MEFRIVQKHRAWRGTMLCRSRWLNGTTHQGAITMIKSFTAGVCIVALTGSLALAQPSQSQGGGNAGTGGTADTTMQNNQMKNNSGTSTTGMTGGQMSKDNMAKDNMAKDGMKKDGMNKGMSK
jgi:pentapeptide MXKDX repeat protein